MPLKINLYHEVLRARHAEQRDPLRLSMYGLIAIVALMAGYLAIVLVGKSSVTNQLAAKNKELQSLKPKVDAAVKEEEALNKELALSDSLKGRMEDRFYWGSLLEQIALLTPPNLQIVHCTGSVTSEQPKVCKVSIEGVATGERPQQSADDFRGKLGEKLKELYGDAKMTVKLNKIEDTGEKTLADGTKANTANFGIDITFQTKATPEPTPPPKRSGRRLSNN